MDTEGVYQDVVQRLDQFQDLAALDQQLRARCIDSIRQFCNFGEADLVKEPKCFSSPPEDTGKLGKSNESV